MIDITGYNKENPRHKKRKGIYQVYPRSWKEIRKQRMEFLELIAVVAFLLLLDKIIRIASIALASLINN